MKRALRVALIQLALLAGAIVVSGALVLIAGKNPFAAWSALASGAFGTWYAFLNVWTRTCPLLLTGLAVAIAFRSGFWNIGAEGQFIVGAIAAGAVGVMSGIPAPLHYLLVAAAGFAAGALWCLAAAWLRFRRGASEVISTILLNFIAAYLLAWLVHGWLMQESRAQPIGDPIAQYLRLPRVGGAGSTLHAGIFLALAAAFLGHHFFRRTATGFHLRAIGANPIACAWAGIPVRRRIATAAILSGGIAGLAGVAEILGVLGRLFDHVSPGYGFTAIAVALLARLEPLALIPSAFLFGALDAGSSRMQQEAGVSGVLVLVIQGVVILASAASGALLVKREEV